MLRNVLVVLAIFITLVGCASNKHLPDSINKEFIPVEKPEIRSVVAANVQDKKEQLILLSVVSEKPVLESTVQSSPVIAKATRIVQTATSIKPRKSKPETTKVVVPAEVSLVYNTPKVMKVAVTERIEVRIGVLDDSIKSNFVGPGELTIGTISVTPHMRVELVGEPNFLIAKLGNTNQKIPDEGHAQWAWNVTPTTHGTHSLHLLISKRFILEGSEDFLDQPPIDRTIDVKVNFEHFVITTIKDNWAWAVGILLSSGILGTFFKRRKAQDNIK